MKEKIAKIKSLIKKDGVFNTTKKVCKYFISEYGTKVNIFSIVYYKLNKKKFEDKFEEILQGEYDRIIIWKSDFGWNVPLFQRPQHIAKNLSDENCLVFYEVTTMTDKVKDLKKIKDNLYLVNLKNSVIKNILFSKVEKKLNKNKYIQFYSTDYKIALEEVKTYIKQGFKIIYEYIDDLSPQILGTDEIPRNTIEKYNYMLKDTKNIFVIVTADKLENDIVEKRGTEKLAFSSNGVDYEHFQDIDLSYKFEEDFENILKQNKPIIGYYGALASWMDYDLIKYLAENRPNYNIVFFGVKYDGEYDKSGVDSLKNVYFLGKREYKVLKNYASRFSVCTIPFKVNNITKSTSPVKLFEYMAIQKPIVTTEMDECKKYKSVMIAKNKEEFVKLVDKAIGLSDNVEYKKELKKEACENTWSQKAKIIVELLKKYE